MSLRLSLKMGNQRRLFNKGMMIARIERDFNKMLNTIKKQDYEINELNRKLEISEKNKLKFARAYCKKINLIMSEKDFKEYMYLIEEDPLDEIFTKNITIKELKKIRLEKYSPKN